MSIIFRVLKMHHRATFETDCSEHLLKRGVSINMRWYTLPWHIVITCQLVKVSKLVEYIALVCFEFP